MRAALLVMIIGVLVGTSKAKVCDITNVAPGLYRESSSAISVFNRTQLNAISNSGCDTIIGDIVIENSYSGPLLMTGVTNLTGKFYFADADFSISPEAAGTVTTVELRDMKYMYYLEINSPSQNISYISLPNATSIHWIQLWALNGTSLNFPVLKSASILSACGNVTEMVFPKLEVIEEKLEICNLAGCVEGLETSLPTTVSFPLLYNGTALTLMGNFENILMPSLVLTRNGDANSLKIVTNGPAIPLNFPLLLQADSLSINGSFTSFSIPLLDNIPGTLKLFARKNVAINIPGLQTAKDIELSGNITSVSFPILTKFQNFTIYSYATLPCDKLKSRFSNSMAYGGVSTKLYFSCTAPGSKSHQLSAAAWKGTVVGGIFLFAFVIWLVMRSIKKRNLKRLVAGLPVIDTVWTAEMDDFGNGTTTEAVGEEITAQAAERVSGDMDEDRDEYMGDNRNEDGEDLPPPYESRPDDLPPPFEEAVPNRSEEATDSDWARTLIATFDREQ